MAYKPKVLVVADGGTGVVSNTAYAVLCGGTSSTGAIQSIASVGTATHVLTSNGAGALPTFQAAPAAGGFLIGFSSDTINPAASTTYHIETNQIWGTTFTTALSRFYFSKASTITTCYGVITVSGTLASAGSSVLSIRLNNTSDTTVTNALSLTTANNTFNNTGMSISISAGDYIQFKLVTPAWATAPTIVYASISISGT